MKTFYIMYYYPPYKIGWTKCYNIEVQAEDETHARRIFESSFLHAIIKGISDYPAS